MRRSTISLRSTVGLLIVFLFALLGAPAAGARAASGTHILSGVPATPQAWSLSCEYAATSAATAYYGIALTQWRLRTAVGTNENPHKGFRGNITGSWGGTTDYGVYAEPIAAILRRNGFTHSYVFYGGENTLRGEIAAGHPVVAWITGTWEPSTRSVLHDAAGDQYSLIPHEHAVTVYGYDDSSVWVMDPSEPSQYHVSWELFLAAWSEIDDMALVVAT